MKAGNTEGNLLRALRDASDKLRDTHGTIVCISPVSDIPIDLQVDVEVVSPGLPSREVIEILVRDIREKFIEEKDLNIIEGEENIERLCDSCMGLTLMQVSHAISKSVVKSGQINLDYIRKARAKAISSVPGLTFIDSKDLENEAEVGGLGALKQWLKEREKSFSIEAKEANLQPVRSILLVGVPGSGKSLIAKTCSKYFNVPLLRLRLPDIKGGIVGSTEQKFHRVREALDTFKGIIWIDELEKSLVRGGSINNDGGASDTILSGTLDLLQERRDGNIIVATSNDISCMPPELIRRGRWDAIFFVDLPSKSEREEIIKIHLLKRQRSISDADIHTIAEKTKGYSGAEIEASIVDGMWKAFNSNRDINASDIIISAKESPPLSKVMETKISKMREWAHSRTRMASFPETKKTKNRKYPKKRESLLDIDNVEG
jgi:ATP-dependent 26S proteasome regulatory subunit